MNTIDKAVFTEQGIYAVNYDHIVVTDASERNLFVNHISTGKQSNADSKVTVLALCGFAALTDNPDFPGDKILAPNATLINKGQIDIHCKDLIEEFRRRMAEGKERYGALRCNAMAAGDNSVIINEGVINVWMDQNPEAQAIIYCAAMTAGANSQVINRGEINFRGCGSWKSLIRGIGGHFNNLHVINEGTITVDVERAFQTRVLHDAGLYGSLWNKGKLKVRVSGRVMTIASVTGTSMVNDGEVEVTSIATLLHAGIPFLFDFPPMATGMYEHFRPGTMLPAPIVNRGSIKVHLVGSEKSGPDAMAVGFYYQMENKDNGETPVRYVSNEGTVEITQEGPVRYQTAELGINMQLDHDNPVKMKVMNWNTARRDFAVTHDLFACNSAEIDLSEMRLALDGEPAGFNADELVYQTETARRRGDTCKVTGNRC